MTAEPASMSAADLKSARGSYTTAQQTAYDSAFTSLQGLADGDEDVRSQTLFTFEANESADKTISFANYAAALYLAYADGDRANCPQDAADLTVTALAGGIDVYKRQGPHPERRTHRFCSGCLPGRLRHCA